MLTHALFSRLSPRNPQQRVVYIQADTRASRLLLRKPDAFTRTRTVAWAYGGSIHEYRSITTANVEHYVVFAHKALLEHYAHDFRWSAVERSSWSATLCWKPKYV
jgi:hypothetical protein